MLGKGCSSEIDGLSSQAESLLRSKLELKENTNLQHINYCCHEVNNLFWQIPLQQQNCKDFDWSVLKSP